MCVRLMPLTAAFVAVVMLAGCESPVGDTSRTADNLRQPPHVTPELTADERTVADNEPILAELQPDCEAVEVIADAAAPSRAPRKIEVLIKSREFEAEGPEKALRVTFDDLNLLKVLSMDPVTTDATKHFPAWLSGLDGKLIRIRGVMYPTFETTGIEQFILDDGGHVFNFGRNPKVYELIAVELKPGTTCDYIHIKAFDVIGTLRIDMQVEDGKPYALYWIDDATVVQ